MKKLNKFIVLAIFLLITPSLFAKTKVKFFLGDATCQLAGEEKWTKLSINQELSTGDTLRTGPKAYIELDIDGNYIKLQESSQMKLSQSLDGENKNDSVDMSKGNLKLKLSKLKKDNRGFQVNTPASVCAVRGTEFTVAAGYDGTTLLQVDEGQVEFFGETKSVLVAKNQQSEVRLGKDPSEVVNIKRQEWEAWFAESRANVENNQAGIMADTLQKMERMQAEIIELERIRAEFDKAKVELDEEAKKLKKEGNTDGFKQKAAEAYAASRKSNVAYDKITYRADKLNLLKEFADQLYMSIDKDKIDAKTQEDYNRIIEIYNTYYKKYIEPLLAEQKQMREMRAKRNK